MVFLAGTNTRISGNDLPAITKHVRKVNTRLRSVNFLSRFLQILSFHILFSYLDYDFHVIFFFPLQPLTHSPEGIDPTTQKQRTYYLK